jgi:hypothetical protein
LGTPDRRNVAVLLAVPLVVFVGPSLFGHPPIAGDNAIQNFPLRALAGRFIAQGHLPLWNPYLWSGTPLLGGLNAGALYPTTLLFVFLPAVLAWLGNLLVAYWAGALGCYALVRQYRISPRPAVLAAAVYAFSGSMAAQMVHLPIVQGFGWVPFMILAQVRLGWALFGTGPAGPAPGADPGESVPAAEAAAPLRATASPWPWVVLLAVAGGLVLLTGEPRGMAEAEVVSVVVAAWMVLRPWGGAVGLRPRLAYLGCSVVAGLWAAALGAVQLLPGWSFISASQRASESYAYFAAGSLRPSWSVLLLVPNAFGGDGFLQPQFLNSYNLPEVTGFVGLMPLVAAAALLWRSFGRRSDPRSSDWGMYLVLGLVGLLAAWGSFFFTGPFFGHLPFFDKLRLQSRNLGVVDLALAVLLAFFAHRVLSPDPAAGGATTRGGRYLALVTPVLAAAVALCLVIDPNAFELAFGASENGAGGLRPWAALSLLLALATGAFVLGLRRTGRTGRRRGLTALVTADIVLFTAVASTGFVSGNVVVTPQPALAAAVLGGPGRFAIYDTTAAEVGHLTALGQPDLNVFTRMPSVQGYGSIVSSAYDNPTGSHDLDTLSPCALAQGAFVPLRLSNLLVRDRFLAPPVPSAAWPPTPSTTCPGSPPPRPGPRTLYLGVPTGVARIDVAPGPGRAARRPPRVGLLVAPGTVSYPATRAVPRPGGGWSVTLVRPTGALGVVLPSGPGLDPVASQVTDTAGQTVSLDGPLQQPLGQVGWRYQGQWRDFARFSYGPLVPVVRLAGGAASGSVRRLQWAAYGLEVDRVTARHPTLLIRSEAYVSGWHAQVARPGRPTVDLPVRRHGLVQAVALPAGTSTVTFLYRPRGLDLGLVGSAVGLLALVGAGGRWWWRRRSRGRAGTAG